MTRPTVLPPRLGRVEFTALLALSMALAALGIDIVLPAFGAVRTDLGLAPDSTEVAGLVTAYLMGLAIGQLGYGPLADRFGRKPTLYLGYGIYLFGAVVSAIVPTLSLMLVARFVWGLGAAGPRVVTLSVVRDRFDGEEMSRAMSFIMAVFILVPILAPSLGAAVAAVGSWRWVFGICAVLVGVMALWATRLRESLAPENRRELSYAKISEAARLVLTNRHTVGYTLALTALLGVFISYIASSEIIFGEVFGIVAAFPLVFGAMAGVMGGAMLANAFVVRRFGTRRMAHAVLIFYVVWAAAFATLAILTSGRPPVGFFLAGLGVMLAAHSLLIPNFNTIAMDPMREVAGMASAVIGTVSTAGGAAIGAVIDRSFDGTVLPLALAFFVLGLTALGLVGWAERGRMFRPLVKSGV